MTPMLAAARAIKPKPCQKCGSKPDSCRYIVRLTKFWRIYCKACDLVTASHTQYREAVIEWNGSLK